MLPGADLRPNQSLDKWLNKAYMKIWNNVKTVLEVPMPMRLASGSDSSTQFQKKSFGFEADPARNKKLEISKLR